MLTNSQKHSNSMNNNCKLQLDVVYTLRDPNKNEKLIWLVSPLAFCTVADCRTIDCRTMTVSLSLI